MVSSLWGKCNGADIIFSKDGQERWRVAVPAAEDKTYIIEVWAEDEAGNVGYFATIEYTYDPATLRMDFKILNIGANYSEDDVRAVFGTKDIRMAITGKEVVHIV